MKRLLVCLIVGAVAMAFVAPTYAGTLDLAKIGLHAQSFPSKGTLCGAKPGTGACDTPGGTSSLVTNFPLNTKCALYIVVMDIPPAAGGLLSIDTGISYNANLGDFLNDGLFNGNGDPDPGADVFTTNVCTDGTEFFGLGWPQSGGVNTITAITCEGGLDATDPQGDYISVPYAMYVYAYTDDLMCLAPKASGVYGLTDCANTGSDMNLHYPTNTGCVGFGSTLGVQPCYIPVVPVEETTWGSIKSQFSGE